MYLFHIILGVCLHLGAVACWLTGIYHQIHLQHEINNKLPKDQQLDPIFWGPDERWKLKRLQRELLPNSPRPRKRALWFALGVAFFLCAIYVLLHA